MRIVHFFLLVAPAALLLAAAPVLRAKTLQFSGHAWDVRPNEVGGPGPNHWSEDNAWVDQGGRLHLLLSQRGGVWVCPEIYTRQKFGFGRYQFTVEGRIDRLDRAVVLGLFDYPDAGQGVDGTHEIDIEFARWGKLKNPNGNYTVFPAVVGVASVTRGFEFRLPQQPVSVHTFTRTPDSISFESRAKSPRGRLLGRWTYAPSSPESCITRLPLPVHLNLWLFESHAPSNGHEVELIIRSFKFLPQRGGGS